MPHVQSRPLRRPFTTHSAFSTNLRPPLTHTYLAHTTPLCNLPVLHRFHDFYSILHCGCSPASCY